MPEPITVASVKLFFSPVLFASFVGAVISLRFVKHLNIFEGLLSVLSGTLIAQYTAPLAAHVFNLDDYQVSFGVLIGIFGLSLTAAVYETIKKADPWGLIMSRYGRRHGE